MNSRVGNMKDFIPEVDKVPERVSIDNNANSPGKAFIDILIETKMAIMNGRCCSLFDSFTCISHKGPGVVHYFAIAHENIQRVTNFEVVPVTEVTDKLNLVDETDSRISEHPVLNMSLCVKQKETWGDIE